MFDVPGMTTTLELGSARAVAVAVEACDFHAHARSVAVDLLEGLWHECPALHGPMPPLERGELGRPLLRGGEAHVCISYAEPWIMAALSPEAEVGADVETIAARDADVARLVCAHGETPMLARVLGVEDDPAVMVSCLFSLKEAAVKRFGMHVRLPHSQVRLVGTREDGRCVVEVPEVEGRCEVLPRLLPGALACLAV